MSHWSRPRGLNVDQRATTATRLRAIADQLDADHAAAVQANLEAWADPTPWPTSTGQGGSSSSPGSPVEHAMGLNRDDDTPTAALPPMAAQAGRLLANLHHLARLAVEVDHGLAENSPKRTVAYCPNPACGRAVAPGSRCTACSTRQEAKPTCADCGNEGDQGGMRVWPPEGRQRPGDIPVLVCIKDWMWRHRHEGRPRNGIERLALGDGLMTEPAGDGLMTEPAG